MYVIIEKMHRQAIFLSGYRVLSATCMPLMSYIIKNVTYYSLPLDLQQLTKYHVLQVNQEFLTQHFEW